MLYVLMFPIFIKLAVPEATIFEATTFGAGFKIIGLDKAAEVRLIIGFVAGADIELPLGSCEIIFTLVKG